MKINVKKTKVICIARKGKSKVGLRLLIGDQIISSLS